MTTAMLKAMAHPLRRRIANALSRRLYARAADLAADLDVPANAVSFHLRTMAAAGLIQEAPERARDRRDRVWTPVKGSLGIDSSAPDRPADEQIFVDALVRGMIDDHLDLVRRVAADRSAPGTESRTTLRHLMVPMTKTAAEEFYAEIDRMVSAAVERFDPGDPDVRVWEIDVVGADVTARARDSTGSDTDPLA